MHREQVHQSRQHRDEQRPGAKRGITHGHAMPAGRGDMAPRQPGQQQTLTYRLVHRALGLDVLYTPGTAVLTRP